MITRGPSKPGDRPGWPRKPGDRPGPRGRPPRGARDPPWDTQVWVVYEVCVDKKLLFCASRLQWKQDCPIMFGKSPNCWRRIEYMPSDESPNNQLATFAVPGGEVGFTINGDKETIWSTRAGIAAAYGCTEENVRQHLANLYQDGELQLEATSKKFLEVQKEGTRTVKRMVYRFNLDAILAVGFKVSTRKALEFRQWANGVLREFITAGYAINTERLANDPAAQQKLAAALREIRHEERAMYAKVREVFKASSSDYDANSQTAKTFFAMAQDKFHYAITGKTASELILERADASKQNMGLRTVKGNVPTSDEVKIGKNYLSETEMRGLENICEQFLLFAESKAFRGHKMTMEELATKLNTLLMVNEYPVLYEYKTYLKARADTHARLELDRYRARLTAPKQPKEISAPHQKGKKKE